MNTTIAAELRWAISRCIASAAQGVDDAGGFDFAHFDRHLISLVDSHQPSNAARYGDFDTDETLVSDRVVGQCAAAQQRHQC